MSDLLRSDREDRRRNRRNRLRRLRVPLLLVSLSVIPGLVSYRVYGSLLFAVVVAVATAASIGAAAIIFRPR